MRSRLWIPIGFALGLIACSQTTGTETPTSEGDIPTPAEATLAVTSLGSEIFWPLLEAVEPSPATIGAELRIIGQGGYRLFESEGGGGYDESYREFRLFLEGEEIGKLGCYVNRCEGEIVLPADLNPGKYELSVEGGSRLTIDAEK